jgi:hypothetical protein
MLHEPFPVLSLHYQQSTAGVSPHSSVSCSSSSKRVAHTPTTGAPNAPRMRRDCFLKRLADRVSTGCDHGSAPTIGRAIARQGPGRQGIFAIS